MKLEIRKQADKTPMFGGGTTETGTRTGILMMTPPINEDYWTYRVHLFKDQYLVGFPKFCTIGIGFSQEEDWNTNLPYSYDADKIADHIWDNRKYDEITRPMLIEAIKLIQGVATQPESKEVKL